MLLLLATVLGGSSGATAQEPELRLAEVDLSGLPRVRLVAVVPESLADLEIGPSAFTVRQGGQPLRPTVRRVVEAGAALSVVIDTAVQPRQLAAAQSAAADLLRSMPRGVWTAAYGGPVTPRPQQTSTAALRALSSLRPNETGTVEQSLQQAVSVRDPTVVRRVVVLFTTCDALERYNLSSAWQLGIGSRQLNVAALGGTCQEDAERLTRPSGGLAVTGLNEPRLFGAADAMARDLFGQFELAVSVADRTRPLVVAVEAYGVQAQATVRVSEPEPASRGGSGRLVALSVLVALGVATVVLAVLLARMDRPRGWRPRGRRPRGRRRRPRRRILSGRP